MTHRSLRHAAALLAALLANPVLASPPAAERGAATEPAPGDAALGCPLHAEHARAAEGDAAHHAGPHAALQARGDRHMGFPQHATSHRFALAADGGAVEVTVNDAADAATIARVREHLRQIATAFAAGDFSIPEAVHAAVPPGSREMAAGGEAIAYAYSDLPAGGRVRIAARTPEALAAVHEFLRFQIADHRTGDPATTP